MSRPIGELDRPIPLKKKAHTVLLLLLAILTPLSAIAADRPNLMILMLEYAGLSDLGCYGGRSLTPHMDSLATEGMRFTDCHATAPYCSPSRIGMMTGRCPIRAGIFNFLDPGTSMHLQAKEVTIANLSHDAGYSTAHFGKWRNHPA